MKKSYSRLYNSVYDHAVRRNREAKTWTTYENPGGVARTLFAYLIIKTNPYSRGILVHSRFAEICRSASVRFYLAAFTAFIPICRCPSSALSCCFSHSHKRSSHNCLPTEKFSGWFSSWLADTFYFFVCINKDCKYILLEYIFLESLQCDCDSKIS